MHYLPDNTTVRPFYFNTPDLGPRFLNEVDLTPRLP